MTKKTKEYTEPKPVKFIRDQEGNVWSCEIVDGQLKPSHIVKYFLEGEVIETKTVKEEKKDVERTD
jgi:hypothetical protein